MFTGITAQDWDATPPSKRPTLALEAVRAYRGTPEYRTACDADRYFRGDNPTIQQRKKMVVSGSAEVDGHARALTAEVQGARVPTNFLFRFVTQLNQFLLANGLQTDDEAKARLGAGFDKTLEALGEKALIHGVAWGFWNVDHLEVIPAADGANSGFVALLDERDGEPRVGVQFWKIADDRPLYLRVFEADGVSVLRDVSEGGVEEVEPKRAYRQRVRVDGLGAEVVGGRNYGALPVVPLYANGERASELTESLRQKIDVYDVILSDFADNLERTNDIYWVINNFGGTADDVIAMLTEINRIKATYTDANGGTQATAEPHTIEVPYQARSAALDLLERALYKDAMALNLNDLTGGSLTNVAIRAAMANLNLKADRYEWQVFQFCQRLLRLLGVEAEDIRFQRQAIANESEIVQNIYAMRADISQRKALELNPYIADDEIDDILRDSDAERVSGLPSLDALQARMNEEADAESEADEA